MSASTKKKLRKEENAAKLTEKQLNEQKEAKKLKGYTLTFAVVVCLVLVAAVVIMGTTAFNNSGIMQRKTDALTVGNHTLNNAELNYFYIDAVNEFYSDYNEQYGEYAAMYMSLMGFDTTLPLNKQVYYGSEDGTTYADMFTEEAITKATGAYAIYDMAVAAGHTLSSELKANLESNIAMAGMYATAYGYSNLGDYLKALYGPGATEETYRTYLEVLAIADSFQANHYDSLSYDDAAIAAHGAENYDKFSSFSYIQYVVDVDDFIVCADPDNTEHTHSEEEIAAAQAAAQAAADSLAAGTYTSTEELDNAINALDVFAGAEKKEVSNAYKGVFYENINADVAAWLVEADRTAGEAAAIPYYYTSTVDGAETSTLSSFYLIVFQGREDNNMNLVNVRHILANFKGGTTDPTTGVTTYTDVEKKEALDRITEIMEQWKADGATEDAFIALASKSEDAASSANGGLCENVFPGQMVASFNDWCFDPQRQAGDYEIVESEYGYHLMYFSSTNDITFRNYMIENVLRNEEFENWYNTATEAMDVKVLNTKYLSLDMVLSNG